MVVLRSRSLTPTTVPRTCRVPVFVPLPTCSALPWNFVSATLGYGHSTVTELTSVVIGAAPSVGMACTNS